MTFTRHTMMWETAVDALERAERMHRQFFRLAGQHARAPVWEPPIEVFEQDGRLAIVVALPGVPPDSLSLDLEGAMLEVLDPEQNATFRDNYLGVPFDLSAVVFVATANQLEGIPGPLRDRLEILDLPGYTEAEKFQIARRFLVPRELEACGLTTAQCELSDEALRAIIRDYTREAGVRSLERQIGSVFRSVALRVAEGPGHA